MKRVVGYIRNSGKKDESRQREAIEDYCARSEMEIIDWITGDRFDYVAYGNWMGRRKIDAVVAATCADVTDNVFEFYAFRCKLMMRNSGLYVTHYEGYKGYDLYKKFFEEYTGMLVRKEFENDPVQQKNGRIRKTLKGGYIGGQAPMGYKVVEGRLVVNPEEVPVVEFIMEEKHRGGTKLGTVEKLNARGFKTRKGGPFQISTVQGIWNNEQLYRGYRKVGDEWVKAQHEAILKD